MRATIFFCLAMFGLGCASWQTSTDAADSDSWPRWRGPQGNGVAVDAAPPISWSESENVRWKVPVPGVGSSTAIVLNDRVYVSAAVKTDRQEEGTAAEEQPKAADPQAESRRGGRRRDRPESPTHYYDFMVLAFDRATGKEIWRTSLTQQVPHEAGHSTNTFASSSPVTDGKHLFVSFGSRGVFCLDLEGKVQWQRDLGQMQTRNAFGEASSPALHNGILVVPWDHEGDSFIVALDAKSGEEKWRTARDEPTTWATPLITDFDGGSQVITNGTNRVRSYDLANGDLIWECGGQVTNPIPTPVRYEDNVICMTGYRGYAIYSIPLSSKGDLTDTDRVSWIEEDAAPYVPSPVLYKGQLYFNKSNTGVLVSRQAKTGELVIEPTRLPEISSIYASPVAANDHIYVTGRDGTTVVLKHGDTMQVVATNKLDDSVDASPAIVGDEIFIRSKSHLYCIAKP